jgi:uncharacterized membrane protein (UPF0182 family)
VANRPPAPPLPQRPRLLVPVLVVLGVLVGLLALAVGLYTDLLWFREVDFTQVFTTVLGTRVLLFALFGAAMAVLVGANITIAYKLRPVFRPLSLEQQNLERYRLAVEPHLLPVLLVVTTAVGVLTGLSAASRWETWLLWRNATPFGVEDPQFEMDVAFYAFQYPFYRFLLGFLFTAVVLSLIAALATHYLFGGLRLQTPGERLVPAARAHISVLAGVFVLLKAVAYWLDRYGLMFTQSGRITGPAYTDINAVLPAKTILAGIAVICALLFFANIRVRNFALPLISLGALVGAAIVIGGLYPAAIQQFRVEPNAIDLEAPYIDRAIEATRSAYRIDEAEVLPYAGETQVEEAEVAPEEAQATLPNARLLDPNILSPTYRQFEQIRNYFGFAETLDIDRYDLGNGLQDYVVAAREVNLAGLAPNQRGWINEHLIYTHGNGFVMAPANTVDENGRPAFAVGNVPPVVAPGLNLEIDEPRIYYGEQSPEYSVVNTDQAEIDGPAAPGVEEEATSRYGGDGGVEMSSILRKTLYALKYRERNLLLSGAINEDSRIMYVREPRDRVAKVAPFLELDGDPYPAVIDGRIVWIVDGYTRSAGYPYSSLRILGDVTADATTIGNQAGNRAVQPPAPVNYIRNSVKATVDAFTGEVVLYAFDETDPVLRTWAKAFPDVVQPAAEISEELRSHFRYPEDLFKVQRAVLASYHETDARAFFSQEDFWRIPADPAEAREGQGPDQPPFYQFIQVPGTNDPAFHLTTSFVAQQRPNLTAFVAVSSEPGDYGEMRVYELPARTAVDGPGTAYGAFRSNQEVAQLLTLLDQQGSQVIVGNLLTIPVADGVLYVQPVYTQARGGESFPLLRRVLLSYGDRIVFTPTLAEGIRELFALSVPEDQPNVNPLIDLDPPPAEEDTTPGSRPATGTSLVAALGDAERAQSDAEAALRTGDFAAYGEAQERLADAIGRAVAAAETEGLTAGPPPADPTGTGDGAEVPGGVQAPGEDTEDVAATTG